ncbi:hypothetical protein OQK15_001703 [Campylobacter jejuni]|nr:hypothetical protein [Campylobacter jejuni]
MKLNEFDFRVWSELENGYVGYPALAKLNSVLPAKFHYVDKLVPCIKFDERDDNKEMELWTGLYNKFGDKIYEGDIVKYCDFENLVIRFENGIFIVSRSYDEFIKNFKYEYNEEEVKNTLFKSSYKLYKQVFDEKMCDNLEIIGNIHENPELLKC